ncbi:MAG TPA: hypothetical protein VN703_00135, partial [Candidatus Sulfopaludibacter sp.]|nr:hypothetical protein [Candidatus Sulfopaludibacter sp.]
MILPGVNILIVLLTILTLILFCSALTESLSIQYQEFVDKDYDWIDMHKNRTYTISGSPYIDILAVNYFSDGKILNSTLWLASPFPNNIDKNMDVNYGMFIDVDSNGNTGIGGIDFQVEISNNNGTMKETIWQHSSLNTSRV